MAEAYSLGKGDDKIELDKTQLCVLLLTVDMNLDNPEPDPETGEVDPEVAKKQTETLHKYANILATLMLNDLRGLMGNDWTIEEVREYRADMTESLSDIAMLRTADLITPKQSKEILRVIWDTPYLVVADYLVQSKILEEAEGDDLLSIVKEVVEANPKVVEEILGGKDKAIGFLVGQVMKQAKGKANPQQAKDMIKAKIEGE